MKNVILSKGLSTTVSLLFICLALPMQIWKSYTTRIPATWAISAVGIVMYTLRSLRTYRDIGMKGYYIIVPDIIGIVVLALLLLQHFSINLWGVLDIFI